MTGAGLPVSAGWLRLREPADAAARSTALVERLSARLNGGPLVIHDLACGTGSMGRWLAPRLRGCQRWVVHDRDAALLEVAASDPPGPALDGSAVVVEPRVSDITRLAPGDLAGAGLITASALLDLMTPDELGRLVGLCHTAACPLLLTLSVDGHVRLAPSDPLDDAVAAAFNDHQRRVAGGGRLLGPDAAAAAAGAFRRLGAEVVELSSPWRLGRAQSELAVAWLDGWTAAAHEQVPELDPGARYAARRRDQALSRRLAAEIGHADLLVIP
jgi:hypothetical protein